ncbi:MAG: hypothetical protein DME26_11925, partial [Verrucomicrobia bacterium]
IYVQDTLNDLIRKGVAANTSTPPVIVSSGTNFGFKTNQFGFDLTGQSGKAAVVEVSTNLLNWLPVRTNTFDTSPFHFIDPKSSALSTRFYRAYLQ